MLDRLGKDDLSRLLINQRELRRRQIAGNRRFRTSGHIPAVAECDLARSDVPTLNVISHNALQFQVSNIEDGPIAWIRKLLGKALCKLQSRDAIAVERLDLPDNLIPRMVLENDRLVPPLVVVIG